MSAATVAIERMADAAASAGMARVRVFLEPCWFRVLLEEARNDARYDVREVESVETWTEVILRRGGFELSVESEP